MNAIQEVLNCISVVARDRSPSMGLVGHLREVLDHPKPTTSHWRF